MWDTASLLLAVIGGYAFSRTFKLTTLSVLKLTGYALFFQSVLWGYVFFHAACLFGLIITLDPGWLSFFRFWASPIDNQFLDVGAAVLVQSITLSKSDFTAPSVAALWLGLLLGYPANRLLATEDRKFAIVSETLTELERFLHRSLVHRQMILVTLESGKVYAGWVIRTPRADGNNNDPGSGFELLAYKSGYREPETQAVNFTTDYSWIVEPDPDDSGPRPPIEQLSTFIALRRLVTVTNFDPEVYPQFRARADRSSLSPWGGGGSRLSE